MSSFLPSGQPEDLRSAPSCAYVRPASLSLHSLSLSLWRRVNKIKQWPACMHKQRWLEFGRRPLLLPRNTIHLHHRTVTTVSSCHFSDGECHNTLAWAWATDFDQGGTWPFLKAGRYVGERWSPFIIGESQTSASGPWNLVQPCPPRGIVDPTNKQLFWSPAVEDEIPKTRYPSAYSCLEEPHKRIHI